jgi:hypothetical protein
MSISVDRKLRQCSGASSLYSLSRQCQSMSPVAAGRHFGHRDGPVVRKRDHWTIGLYEQPYVRHGNVNNPFFCPEIVPLGQLYRDDQTLTMR